MTCCKNYDLSLGPFHPRKNIVTQGGKFIEFCVFSQLIQVLLLPPESLALYPLSWRTRQRWLGNFQVEKTSVFLWPRSLVVEHMKKNNSGCLGEEKGVIQPGKMWGLWGLTAKMIPITEPGSQESPGVWYRSLNFGFLGSWWTWLSPTIFSAKSCVFWTLFYLGIGSLWDFSCAKSKEVIVGIHMNLMKSVERRPTLERIWYVWIG